MKQTHGGKALGLAMILALLWTPAAAAGDRLTIDQAVSLALENNRLIRAAVETSRAAVADKEIAQSDFFPDFTATYRYTNLADTPFMYFEKTTVAPHPAVAPYVVVSGSQRIEAPTNRRDNVYWNLRLTQPLFTGFALTTRRKMAQTGIAMRQVELARARLDVIRQVRLACIQVLATGRQLAVAREAAISIGAHVRDAERFYQQGLIPFNDLLQSRVALAHARQQQTDIGGRVRLAVAALNTLIGVDIDQDTRVVDICEKTGSLPEMDALRKKARQERPELKALELALEKMAQALDLTRSVYYPQVALVGQYYQEGDNFEASRNDFRNDHNASVTLQAQWLFHTGGKTRAETAKLNHERKALEEQQRGVAESIDLEVTDARIRLGVAAENIHTAQQALDQARENLRIIDLRYGEQIATSTDVLDATTARTRAETNYYGAIYGYQAARVELDRAVGKTTKTSAKDDKTHGES